MTKVGGAPIPQSIVTPKKVVSTPTVAPVSKPDSPSKSAPPGPTPVLTQSESSVVEASVSTSSPTQIKATAALVKEIGVDVASDLEAPSEPKIDLKSSKAKLSEALKSLKANVKSIVSSSLFNDFGHVTAEGMMGRIFNPEASLKDKILGLTLRSFAVTEFNSENNDFLDAMMGISDMEPGAEQDQALTTLYERFIPDNSDRMLNVSFKQRKAVTDVYPTFATAKEAYATDPSEDNLAALNVARAALMDKLEPCRKESIRLVKDSTARFLRTTLLTDLSALSDGKFSVADTTLGKALRSIGDTTVGKWLHFSENLHLGEDRSVGKALYLSEQLDKTVLTAISMDDYAQEKGVTTVDQLKARKAELNSKITELRYGSSTTDQIKRGLTGKWESKVLSATQIEELKSMYDEVKKINQCFGSIDKAIQTRTQELDKHVKLFKQFQTQLADPDFLTHLKTAPLA